MDKELKITKNDKRKVALDYRALFSEGIAHVRHLASDIWTDYNAHDPGVTVLEVLSYALTDLSLRAELPIQDLLALNESEENASKTNNEYMASQFLSARRILPNRPLTELDYRKLIIDLPGIRNAWIYPAQTQFYADKINKKLLFENTFHQNVEPVLLKGLYNIKLELESRLKKAEKQKVIEQVRQLLHENRNLCEDFLDIGEVKTQSFLICGEIEISPNADVVEINAQINSQITNYLSPNIKNYTLNEALDLTNEFGEKYTTDELFSGPALRCGFILDEHLTETNLKEQLYLSDVISIIMDIMGVVSVRDIIVNPTALKKSLENKWIVQIKDKHRAVLNYEKSSLLFYKKGYPVKADKAATIKRSKELAISLQTKSVLPIDEDIKIPLGENRNSSNYYPFKYHFPEVYGISENGLPSSANEERKSQALQLEGYLLFIEQILGNYLSQLSQLPQLFSSDENISQTYFSQSIKGYDKLYATDEPQELLDNTLADKDKQTVRKNLFLDHLISRFAEDFTDIADVLYSNFSLSEQQLIEQKCQFLNRYDVISKDRGLAYNYTLLDEDKIWNTDNISGFEKRISALLGIDNWNRRDLANITFESHSQIVEATEGEEINTFRFRFRSTIDDSILLSSSTNYQNKEDAQKELDHVLEVGADANSYERLLTEENPPRHYFNVVDATGEVIARRIEYFTSKDEMNAEITKVKTTIRQIYSLEGMHVIENILLRPTSKEDPLLPICVDDNCEGCADLDPYSYRLQIILPAYGERFEDIDFREFSEDLIRNEIPAHIMAKICWISKKSMSEFQIHYKKWLSLKATQFAQTFDSNTTSNTTTSGISDSEPVDTTLAVDLQEQSEILSKFINALFNTKNVYYKERLHDCEGEDNSLFVLGRSTLGSIDPKE
ncbi:diguanylate cyclase [Candidatus Colwellia aromaticivorans]|uniref:diguanylate cyclase n=1 Tax=Candidatus Colwellia aromaticivorans TaxID=2267621 RepID=UPI000DF2C51D|nr:diguanylate cyclase [Candidatus Colwellia aromaticivorans]